MNRAQDELIAAIVGDAAMGQLLAPKVTGSLPGERLIQIYRHNFLTRFEEALQVTFPKTRRILGAGCFAKLAQDFIQQRAFSEASLLLFGADFAAFLATHERLQAHVYCADLARLEWAMEMAYNQASEPINIENKLCVQPQLQIVQSKYALFDIWHFDGEEVFDVAGVSQWVLVYRDGYEVMLSHVDPQQGAHIQILLEADASLQAEVINSLAAEQLTALQAIGVITQGGNHA